MESVPGAEAGPSSPRELAAAPDLPPVVNICDTGDVVLDVTFSPSNAPRRVHRVAPPKKPATTTTTATTTTSTPVKKPPNKTTTTTTPSKTTRTTSKIATTNKASTSTPGKTAPKNTRPPKTTTPSSSSPTVTTSQPPPPPHLPPQTRVAYRVSLAVLAAKSAYFRNLLTNPSFSESRLITARLAALALPASAVSDPASLPWIPIVDDDEATYCPDRAPVLADLLRILHSQPPAAAATSHLVPDDMFAHAVTLVILADRYACLDAVRPAAVAMKLKWPPLPSRTVEQRLAAATAAEETLRKSILVAYCLGNAPRLLTTTRELILRGSRRWATILWDESSDTTETTAAWWSLPDGLESELQHRRDCVLNALASVPRHFIRAYSSRTMQCQRGYDTSPACDSFQLGQMLKFLARKGLVYLFDFGPSSLDALPDSSRLHATDVLDLLKECPSYQIDKHHTNCGLRTRLEPILPFLEAMLASSQALAVRLEDWKRGPGRRDSWIPPQVEKRDRFDDNGNGSVRRFEFTRAMVQDPVHHQVGIMGADALARKLFTATQWDWTPEMVIEVDASVAIP